MKTYLFNTASTMKPYNCSKWWIDADIIRPIEVEADDLKTALIHYKNIVADKSAIDISNTAILHPEPMYIDNIEGEPIQVGYVITASTDFEDSRNYRYSKQYIDLWVTVKMVSTPFMEV